MIQHTFGFESHGMEEVMEKTKQALRGVVRKLIVNQQANGIFLTIECEDTQSLAEASLIAGCLMGEHLKRIANYPVNASVTFVERTLHPMIPSPPLSLPTSPFPDRRTHPQSGDTLP